MTVQRPLSWLLPALAIYHTANAQERLPPITPEQYTEEQQNVVAEVAKGPRTELFSPLNPMLRSPQLAYTAERFGSWGPVMWVMLGEMFPNQLRGSALAVAGAAQWIANFTVSSSFPWLSKHVGLPSTYGAYTAFALLSFFFVRSHVRETNGIELEAMRG